MASCARAVPPRVEGTAKGTFDQLTHPRITGVFHHLCRCRHGYSHCSANPQLPFAPHTEASVDRHLAEAEFQSIYQDWRLLSITEITIIAIHGYRKRNE